jgi:hypothetical protein
MKKRLIISLMLVLAIISLSTAFIPSDNNDTSHVQTNLVHPEAGYIENIGD